MSRGGSGEIRRIARWPERRARVRQAPLPGAEQDVRLVPDVGAGSAPRGWGCSAGGRCWPLGWSSRRRPGCTRSPSSWRSAGRCGRTRGTVAMERRAPLELRGVARGPGTCHRRVTTARGRRGTRATDPGRGQGADLRVRRQNRLTADGFERPRVALSSGGCGFESHLALLTCGDACFAAPESALRGPRVADVSHTCSRVTGG